MSNPIRQHTNPKMSLKRFTEKGLLLSCINNEKISRVSTKKASVIDNFYTTSISNEDPYAIEHILSAREDKTSPIFDKIEKDTDYKIKDKEMEEIYTFISLQFIRTANFKNRVNEQIFKTFKIDPNTLHNELSVQLMMNSSFPIFEILKNKNLEVIEVKGDNRYFITADNPVIFYKKGGLEDTYRLTEFDTVIYPLSRNKILVFTDESLTEEDYNNFEGSGLSITDTINIILYKQNNKKIYCHFNDGPHFLELINYFNTSGD